MPAEAVATKRRDGANGAVSIDPDNACPNATDHPMGAREACCKDARGKTKRCIIGDIERFGLENGQIVPISRRVTTTTVQNRGFLRQLLGSIGRFTAGDFVE